MSVTNYYLPRSLDEAVKLLAQHEESMVVMAGGTIAMPLINEGISTPERVMGLRRSGLDYVRHHEGKVIIGAATTLTEILELDTIPMLQAAARNTASWAIRNMATVGGNLFAPPPAGDFAVALLALDARLRLIRQGGERLVSLADFYTGFMSTVLMPGELLAEIQIAVPKGKTAYVKHGRKQANTPAVVTVAALINRHAGEVQDARIALNGVGPHPLRASRAETILLGSVMDDVTISAAAAAAAEDCEPFSDAIASDWYRRKMVSIFVTRALGHIADEEALP